LPTSSPLCPSGPPTTNPVLETEEDNFSFQSIYFDPLPVLAFFETTAHPLQRPLRQLSLLLVPPPATGYYRLESHSLSFPSNGITERFCFGRGQSPTHLVREKPFRICWAFESPKTSMPHFEDPLWDTHTSHTNERSSSPPPPLYARTN